MNGFHLIELLITLSVIVILAAMSIPTYSQYLVYEKRIEAKSALAKLAIKMEHYHIEHNTYEGATLDALRMPAHIAKDNYQLHIQMAKGADYTLAAIPLGRQAEKDMACGTLTLNAVGKKGITGTGDLNECW